MDTVTQESNITYIKTLMQIADYAGIPKPIMTYLLDNEITGTMNDIRLMPIDDVKEILMFYDAKYMDEPEKLHVDPGSHKSFGIYGGLV